VEVARAIAEELTAAGCAVDVVPVAGVTDLAEYDAVVLGGPMIMGWHRAALGFLRRHRAQLQQMPVAAFVLAMSLTDTGTHSVDGIAVQVDERLPKAPIHPGRLSFRERYAQLENYVRPILAALRPARPVAVGMFGGRLEYGRLPVWAVLFAMFVIQAPAADRRHWPFIRRWAAGLPQVMGFVQPETAEPVAVA
jgi:menaquinone-dependent protoporphyrinogen IX oxidase